MCIIYLLALGMQLLFTGTWYAAVLLCIVTGVHLQLRGGLTYLGHVVLGVHVRFCCMCHRRRRVDPAMNSKY